MGRPVESGVAQEIEDGLDGFGSGDGAEGFLGLGGSAGDVAGPAFGVLENADGIAQRSGLGGVGDAVEGDQGGADGGGEVHAAAVVA